MAATLASILTRVEEFLMDAANVKYSEANITEALRLALAGICLAAGQDLTVDGLDGATATTLPARLDSVLIVGAVGFCGTMRGGARADWESQAQGEPQQVTEWGEYWLKHFRASLGEFYPGETGRMYDQRRTNAPWTAWTDDFGEKEK